MARDDAAAAKMAVLFDPEPGTWGLRGDPTYGGHFAGTCPGTDIPPSADAMASLLHAALGELVGLDLVTDTALSVTGRNMRTAGCPVG